MSVTASIELDGEVIQREAIMPVLPRPGDWIHITMKGEDLVLVVNRLHFRQHREHDDRHFKLVITTRRAPEVEGATGSVD